MNTIEQQKEAFDKFKELVLTNSDICQAIIDATEGYPYTFGITDEDIYFCRYNYAFVYLYYNDDILPILNELASNFLIANNITDIFSIGDNCLFSVNTETTSEDYRDKALKIYKVDTDAKLAVPPVVNRINGEYSTVVKNTVMYDIDFIPLLEVSDEHIPKELLLLKFIRIVFIHKINCILNKAYSMKFEHFCKIKRSDEK